MHRVDQTGYLHASYAASFREVGTPRELKRSGAWILERPIEGRTRLDAMGIYPLLLCHDWSGLAADLDEIGHALVCLGVVTDPFGERDEAYLRRCFPDVMMPFKEHYVVDLRRQHSSTVSAHHRRRARNANRTVSVEICSDPIAFSHDWVRLYDVLVQRHRIRGMLAFSPQALTAQLAVPGLVTLRAVQRDKTVGMQLWYVVGNIGYWHLSAYDEDGYAAAASYALLWRAIDHFAALGLTYLNLGAGAGIRGTAEDGLTLFKRGWATETRTAYFCGRVFDQTEYQAICVDRGAIPGEYFPAYRRGEFG